MRRGTTPTHVFEVPINIADIKELKITYCQENAIVLEKKLKDCKNTENKVNVTLTQEDTFLFREHIPANIQLRVLDVYGHVTSTDVASIPVLGCLDSEVLK